MRFLAAAINTQDSENIDEGFQCYNMKLSDIYWLANTSYTMYKC